MADCACPHHPFGCYGHPESCKCAGRPMRRLTTRQEVIFGGIRLDPGTYEVRRVDTEMRDDEF